MLRFALVCFVVVCFVVALPAMADDGHGYAVGSCKPRFTSFPTISAAVSSVPAGSTILVCPGTYPEQVMISQPVTLIGIASAGQDEAAIVVPGGGLSQNVTSIFGEGVAAQVLVQTPGPVNLINLSVDGTGSDAGCAGGTWVAGIFYAPGSSGTVSRARASGQMNSGCGAGIWAENDGVSNQSVDVGESSVHDVSNVGVFMAESGNAPTFWVRVHGNTVNVPSGLIGIAVTGEGGVVVLCGVGKEQRDQRHAGGVGPGNSGFRCLQQLRQYRLDIYVVCDAAGGERGCAGSGGPDGQHAAIHLAVADTGISDGGAAMRSGC